ncbi:hypothetical protein O181_126319 [Austropuccinia psidii MF-1]|uniref:Uncharacterized protein n=1 Tax=Austropuccinia psidii MF-1 TaxID=1389203 RepID=A0A9Q3KT35_9BASI|nr:hypothetical protein [Austropuccinia psidii MF-1]
MDTEWCIVCDTKISNQFSSDSLSISSNSAFCSTSCLLTAYIEAARNNPKPSKNLINSNLTSNHSKLSKNNLNDSLNNLNHPLIKNNHSPITSHFTLKAYGSYPLNSSLKSSYSSNLSSNSNQNSPNLNFNLNLNEF